MRFLYRRALTRVVGAAAIVAVTGCLDNPGRDPVVGEFSFPTAVALGPEVDGEAESLFVLNTNFDLRYNNGQVQALDLDCVNQTAELCGDDFGNCAVPCDLFTGEVWVGSYGAGMVVASGGDRLYVAVRSTDNITTIQIGEDGSLSCGTQSDDELECDEDFERVDEASARNIAFPLDPVAIELGELSSLQPELTGEFMITAHRNGEAGLLLVQPNGIPRIVDVVTDLPFDLTGVTVDPQTNFAWLTTSSAASVGRVGIALDAANPSLEYSYLYDAGELAVRNVSDEGASIVNSTITRFDPRPDSSLVYILTRRVEAVLIADLDQLDATGVLPSIDAIEVGAGPSRLEIAEIEGRQLGFVSCFDTRDLEVVDLDRRRLLGTVKGLSGPFELAIDLPRQRVYVADFTASVLRVLSLEPLVACLDGSAEVGAECAPEVIGTIGEPRAREELE